MDLKIRIAFPPKDKVLTQSEAKHLSLPFAAKTRETIKSETAYLHIFVSFCSVI